MSTSTRLPYEEDIPGTKQTDRKYVTLPIKYNTTIFKRIPPQYHNLVDLTG